MTIETTIKNKAKDTILTTKDGVEFRVPTTIIPANTQVGESVWVTIDTVPPATVSPKDILNELLGSDQYEEAV